TIAAQCAAQIAFKACFCGSCLLLRRRDENDTDSSRDQNGPEDAAPSEEANNDGARQWRQNRRYGENQHQKRHETRRLNAGVKITYDRTGNNHAGSSTEPLHKTEKDEHIYIGRDSGTDAADTEQHQAAIEWKLAPDHVGQRPAE